MVGSILGNRVLRKEDPKFLTTGGVYVDDLHGEPLLANAAHATYVRSSIAHGSITNIDISEALKAPGVIAIYTATDLDLQPVAATFNPKAKRTLLATDKVRYVGEPIAVILTELANQGEDAIERVIVDYDALEVLIDVEAAMTSSTL
ncbi:MAG: xanthine dehydrogenase family protein molybdopterin-binding subunit, partial [Ilumatobacteraceae bacterium]